mmetsp:Transcript_88981/g.157545  ORF Transcript_88981/g.157545 Transcript_88981/m.157545 type:complete len:84 (+) Transcript_88981:2361-2612(+)
MLRKWPAKRTSTTSQRALKISHHRCHTKTMARVGTKTLPPAPDAAESLRCRKAITNSAGHSLSDSGQPPTKTWQNVDLHSPPN